MQDPLVFGLAATAGPSVGLRFSLPLIPAEAAGYTLSILTIGLFPGPILAGVPALALAMRLTVGTYLLWLAIRLWRRGGAAHRTGGGNLIPRVGAAAVGTFAAILPVAPLLR